MKCEHCNKTLDNTLLDILLHERDCPENPAIKQHENNIQQ
jgi:hypothetical protein